jgi:hypothetical protein
MSEESKNSFKELEKLEEEKYANKLHDVKKKVDGNLNSVHSMLNIVDVYFSKLLGYFVSMIGGEKSDKGMDV